MVITDNDTANHANFIFHIYGYTINTSNNTNIVINIGWSLYIIKRTVIDKMNDKMLLFQV